MRRCMRCGRKIQESGIGNRIKMTGKENYWRWIFRHIKQFFSLIRHGFIKPETEGFIELCDICYEDFISILAFWIQVSKENVLSKLGARGTYTI